MKSAKPNNQPSQHNLNRLLWRHVRLPLFCLGIPLSMLMPTSGHAQCSYSLTPTNAQYTASGGTGSVSVRPNRGNCAWTANSSDNWITITAGTSGTGRGTVSYSIAANTSTSARTGTIRVESATFTVNQAGASCSYSISPTSASVGSGGGTGSVSVSATTGCSWTATSSATWITITAGSSGSGNGTVNYSVASNISSSSRSGTLTIAGQTFSVSQAGATSCSYSISPTSGSVGSGGGTGSVSVSATSGCAWTATSNVTWITITAGGSGSGNGTVSYSVASNSSSSSRSGTLTIAGQTFTINQEGIASATAPNAPSDLVANALSSSQIQLKWTDNSTNEDGFQIWQYNSVRGTWIQINVGANTTTYTDSGLLASTTYSYYVRAFNSAGYSGYSNFAQATTQSGGTSCSYSISPTSASVGSGGGTGSVSVSATTGCSWTATSNAAWITITAGSSGTGNGTVNYSVAANISSSTRSGTLTIAGQTFTINQAGASCSYTISPTSASVGSGGGTGSVSVSATSGCSWTASSNAAWITITAGNSGSGNGTVNYSVASNSSSSSRSGTLTIAGQTFTVNQAGDTPPTVTLTAPQHGSTVSGTITVSANASDDKGISKVEFYRNSSILIGTRTSSPYSISFDTTTIADGTHSFHAKAYDTVNNATSSAAVTVTVSNASVPDSWMMNLGGSGTDVGLAIRTDASDNIVVGGHFQDTVNFGDVSLSSSGGSDIFIAKYNPQGTLLWCRSFGGTLDENLNRLAVDPNGDVLLTGAFTGSINFGGGVLTSAGARDIFLVKLSGVNGAHQWSKRFGSIRDDVGNSVIADAAGNVILTGYFMDTVTFGGVNLTSSSDGYDNDAFLAKFSAAGAHLWSKTFVNGGFESGRGVAVDGSGNIFLVGAFNGMIDFGGGVWLEALNGFNDIFLAKFSAAGAHQWSKHFGAGSHDYGQAVAVDGSGDVVITGIVQGSVDFGGGLRSGGSMRDVFVAKFAGVNGAHRWSQVVGGTGHDEGTAVATDGVGNVVVTGLFRNTVNFGTGGLVSAGLQDAFVAKYTASGTIQWAKRYGGADADLGTDVAADRQGRVLATGYFMNEGQFENVSITSNGGLDVFILKLAP